MEASVFPAAIETITVSAETIPFREGSTASITCGLTARKTISGEMPCGGEIA